MEVTYWQPPADGAPGVCRVDKRGSVIVGSTLITVTASREGSLVHWQEDATIRLLGPVASWPNRIAGRRIFGRVLDGLLTDRP
jgi:hypothetical protein